MIYNFEYDFNDRVVGVEVDYEVDMQVNKFGVEHDSSLYTDIIVESIGTDDEEFEVHLSQVDNWNKFEDWVIKNKYDELMEAYADRE